MKKIDVEGLKAQLESELHFKTKNKIVTEIRARGYKIQQYHLDKFLAGNDVKLSTLEKLDKYLNG